jgi:hypothetical protein
VGSFSWATTRQHFFFSFLHFCMCAVRSSTHSLSLNASSSYPPTLPSVCK